MAIDTILHSLHSGYDQFKLNYSMNSLDKTLTELHSILKTAEKTLKSDEQDDLIVRGASSRNLARRGMLRKVARRPARLSNMAAPSLKRRR